MPNHRCARAVADCVSALGGSCGDGGEKKTHPSSHQHQAQHSHHQRHHQASSTKNAHAASFAPGGGSAATAALTKRLAMMLLACLVAAPAVRAQVAWTPAVCGGARSADYCSSGNLMGWERDVRALQALYRDCGGGRSWQSWAPGPWEKIPSFSGTRADWDGVCATQAAGAELECDYDGRVILIHVKQFIALTCPVGLPTEFSDLTQLSHIQMDAVLGPSGGIDVAHCFGPLLSLTNLRVMSFAKNSLTGVMPALCTFTSFTESARKLERLRLGKNALRGQPTSSLECLTNLQELDVSFNKLTGQLPDAWASLRTLQTLQLSGNSALGGTIPTAWFVSGGGGGGMNDLITLEAAICGLTGMIPKDLGALSALQTVNLEHNKLTGSLPASIINLTNLVSFDISDNELAGSLPANVFAHLNLRLQEFDLSHNLLSGTIPPMSTGAQNLRNLDLSNNHLEGSIPSLATATALATLSLANNRLNGSIPDLSALYILNTLKLQHNALTGALPDLSRISLLKNVDISVNQLSSGLETWLGTNKPYLGSVNLARNNLTGELPSTLCFDRLSHLDFSGNDLWGTVPESIGTCTSLVSLHLGAASHELESREDEPSSSSSRGVSTLPSSAAMAKLTRLTELSFAGLGLEGTVPTSLFSLPRLKRLDLSHNDLTGSVPNVTNGGLQYLVTLNLENNKLTGDVSVSLLTLPRLLELHLSDNLITGLQIPADASSFASQVISLHLEGNVIDSFPAVLRNMTSLTTLDLSRNRLTGAPPAWVGRLQRLKVLRLGHNNLRGPLTAWLNEDNTLTELTKLELDGNVGVTGPLTAAAIRPLAKLRALNLNDVESFGAFPESLGIPEASLGALVEFHAANAGLTGQLPPRLFEALKSLERLDLRRNALTGTIPRDADATVYTASTSGGGGGSRRRTLLQNASTASTSSTSSLPVLTHARLSSLYLSDNKFGGLVPALPSQLLSQIRDGVNTAIDLRDAAGVRGFDCPLPSSHAAYATADCTCGAGRAGPDVDGLGPGRYQCDACLPGTVAPVQGTTQCARCPLGRFASDVGGTACRECRPGTTANATGAARCERCLPGTVAPDAASSSCTACSAGFHQPEAGAETCLECLPGSAARAGSAACSPCGVGTFAAAARAAVCVPCAPGSYQERTDVCTTIEHTSRTTDRIQNRPALFRRSPLRIGQSGCVDCPSGTASNVTGAANASVCAPCPAGSSTRGDRAQPSCFLCEPGSFAGPGVGAARCQLAPAGHVAADVGASSASKCPPGTHAPTRGSTECLPCPPNHYQPYEGKDSCVACPDGAESDGGGVRCKCRAGHAAAALSGGGITCTPCAAGYHAPKASSDYCEICGGDTFAAVNGSAACSGLLPGHVGADFVDPSAMKGARKETPCPAGTRVRSSLVGLAMVSVCEPCANGTVSGAASSNCTACRFGSYSNDERTACLEMINVALASSASDDNGTSADTSLVGRAVTAAADGKFGGQMAAFAFFILLGICSVVFGVAAGLYRRRKRRLHALALEREYLLEAAEAELATGRPMRRETLYALAGVDAETAALGGGGGVGGGGGGGMSAAAAMRRKSAAPTSNPNDRRRRTMTDMGGGGGAAYSMSGLGGGGGDHDQRAARFSYAPDDFDSDVRRGSAPVHTYSGNDDDDDYYVNNADGGGDGGGGKRHRPSVRFNVDDGLRDFEVGGGGAGGGGGGGGGGGSKGGKVGGALSVAAAVAKYMSPKSKNWDVHSSLAEEEADAHAHANANANANANAPAYYHRQSPAQWPPPPPPPPTAASTEDIFLSDSATAPPPSHPPPPHHQHRPGQHNNHQNNTTFATPASAPPGTTANGGGARFPYTNQTPPPRQPHSHNTRALDDRFLWSQ